MINPKRRTFLKKSLASGIILSAASAGLLKPVQVLAAAWPKNAFAASDIDSALTRLYGNSQFSPSKAIKLKAPVHAENGAAVPVTVSTTLPNVRTISVLVKENRVPLVLNVRFFGATGYITGRVKMSATSDVYAVVQSDGKLYGAKRMIKVTVGGCGG
ncbi:MAG: thiosulfate oxidation carrier protein SoxY [Gammaproteobacteria bacterium]|nr:MAG: thiosulfate oxidation carrier protein SoxY [Gammaproteobacteria bacterium]